MLPVARGSQTDLYVIVSKSNAALPHGQARKPALAPWGAEQGLFSLAVAIPPPQWSRLVCARASRRAFAVICKGPGRSSQAVPQSLYVM
jgi:hypothetical protein